jgi:hypothetical protein
MMDIHVDELPVDFDNQQKQINVYQHYQPGKEKDFVIEKTLFWKKHTITPTPIPFAWIVNDF